MHTQLFTTNQPRSLLASRHHAFAKTVDAIATVNTSAEDVGWDSIIELSIITIDNGYFAIIDMLRIIDNC